MKVIDLLNKIANNEELPKKILLLDTVFYLIEPETDFFTYTTVKNNEKDWKCWIDNRTNLIKILNKRVLVLDLVTEE